jgi:hypothetical protein
MINPGMHQLQWVQPTQLAATIMVPDSQQHSRCHAWRVGVKVGTCMPHVQGIKQTLLLSLLAQASWAADVLAPTVQHGHCQWQGQAGRAARWICS